nr:aminotransferase class I/II-fold pyridoxal phosphate-dependent enzyme [Butyricicoccus sp. AF10-3]
MAEVCCRHNIYVIADEIYCNLVYDNNEFVSFASLGEDVKERTILVNGVSKSYAMTGWRIGYSASNPQLAKVMANYLSHSTSAPSTISQQAAITALTGPQEDMQVMKQAFEQRRDHLVERMNQIEGVSCIKPEGAFYVMMNMKASSARPCTARSSRAPRTSRSCSLRRVWLRPFRAPHLPRRASSAGAMRPRSPRSTRASTASRRLSRTRKHS